MPVDSTLIITVGGRYRCTRTNWLGSGQWSDSAKLYAPTAGRAWVAVDGRRTELRPGRLYLIPPHHRLEFAAEPEMEVDWLHFVPESPVVDARLAALGAVHPFPAAVAARWRPVGRRCAEFFAAPTPVLTFRMQAMVSELVGLALEQAPVVVAEPRLLAALRYMEDHLTRPVSLAEMAASAGLSAGHFHRLFRAQFHTTPFLYLLRRRMAMAHRRLAEGSATVKEVAAACGYDDPYYFSRVFRQTYHCSPREVRAGTARPAP